MHNKPSRRKYWYYRGHHCFISGVAFNHYCCQQAIDAETKAVSSTDTVKFCRQYLTQPSLAPTDILIHALRTLTYAMHHTPAVNSEQQLLSIYPLHCLFHIWRYTKTTTSPEPNNVPILTPSDVTRLPQYSPAKKPSHPSKAYPPQLPKTQANIRVPKPSKLPKPQKITPMPL